MRILLLQPPVEDFYDTDIRLQPLGLCYLKATAKKFHPDVEVMVKDYHSSGGKKTIPTPSELTYLKDYYTYPDNSPFCGFHHYYHFGKSFDEIEKDIWQIKPDFIGISSLFTPYYREVVEIARRVKKILNIPVLVGGSHVSALPEFMLAQPSIDFIIRGEGEKPFVQWLEYLKGTRPLEAVSGLGYKTKTGELKLNPIEDNLPIDEIPLPDLSDLLPTDYSFYGKPMSFLITSRSCPHRCSFCSVHLTFGEKYRRRNLTSVLQEIETRYAEGYRVFDFEDDNLTFYKPQMKELCRELISRFANRPIQLVAMNGISYLSLDDELLQLMKEAGFTKLNLALVSSDQTVRESTKRPHTIEAYLQVVERARQLGFKTVSYQILGLPNESLASMLQTLAFNARLPVLLGASMFYLTPNSPIAKKLGISLGEKDYFKARLTSMAQIAETFTRDDIYTLFISTRILNFLKGLDFSDNISLPELLNSAGFSGREAIGLEQLRQVFKPNGLLHFSTSTGFHANHRFKVDLFKSVIEKTQFLTSQAGKRLNLTSQRKNVAINDIESIMLAENPLSAII